MLLPAALLPAMPLRTYTCARASVHTCVRFAIVNSTLSCDGSEAGLQLTPLHSEKVRTRRFALSCAQPMMRTACHQHSLSTNSSPTEHSCARLLHSLGRNTTQTGATVHQSMRSELARANVASRFGV